MEKVFTCLATFVWHLFVGTDNAIANGTFGLALESADNISSKCG